MEESTSEVVLVKAKFSWLKMLGFACVFGGFFGFILTMMLLTLIMDFPWLVAITLPTGFLFVGGIIFVSMFFTYRNAKLTLTNRKVFLSGMGMGFSLPVDSITSVTKSIFGMLQFTHAGAPGKRIMFVANRDEFAEALNEIISARAQHGTTVVVQQPAVSSNNLDDLQKLKDLLDKGIITQEEFDSKKKHILGL